MTKTIASIIIAMLLIINPVSLDQRLGISETCESEGSQLEKYIISYLSCFDREAVDVSLSAPIPLKNALTDEDIAVCYTINQTGYVILNLSDYSINEYDLYSPHPVYKDDLNTYYYGGLFWYFYEKDSELIDAYSQKPVSKDTLIEVYKRYEKDYPVLSKSELSVKVEKYIDYAASRNIRENIYRSTNTNTLSYSYSTVFVNGECGATACANLIDFCARRDNDYRIKGGLTQLGLIQDLIPRVTPTYGTADLADGVNEYIDEINEDYPSNPILLEMLCLNSFQYGTVVDCIDQDIPITVGGEAAMLDGCNDTTSHVVSVYGYYFIVNAAYDIYYYTLTVNNGWGSNTAKITYWNTPPSTLSDHVLLE